MGKLPKKAKGQCYKKLFLKTKFILKPGRCVTAIKNIPMQKLNLN